MTEIYFPFDAGAGSAIVESQWFKMARLWRGDGPIMALANKLAVTGDSSGMQVKMATGSAWVQGGYYENDAIKTNAIDASHATLNRIDVIVLRLDWTANTILVAVLKGTNAASPVAPTVTQTFGTLWEIALAQVYVAAGVTTITAGAVTDKRVFSYPVAGNPTGIARRAATVQSIPNNANTLITLDSVDVNQLPYFDIATSPTRLTLPIKGHYLLVVDVSFAGNVSGLRYASLLLNGGVGEYNLAIAPVPSVSYVSTVRIVIVTAEKPAGTYYELQAYQNSGIALDVTARISATLLRETA